MRTFYFNGYGAQSWILNDTEVKGFHKTWNRCVRRLLKVPNMTHTRFLSFLMQCKSSEEQICERFTAMVRTMNNSSNMKVKFIAERGINIKSTIIGQNLSFIKLKTGASVHSIVFVKQKLCFNSYDVQDYCTLAAINELTSFNVNIYDVTESVMFKNFLCSY